MDFPCFPGFEERCSLGDTGRGVSYEKHMAKMWEALELPGKAWLLLEDASSAETFDARVAEQELAASPLLLSVLLGKGLAATPEGPQSTEERRGHLTRQSSAPEV